MPATQKKPASQPTHAHTSSAIFLFGGTFDPIHYGHIAAINYLASRFPDSEHRLLPNRQPVHKPAPTDSRHRLAMLEACQPHFAPNILIDSLDLTLQNANTTLHSLQALRELVGPKRPLVWVMGDDVFRTIDTWGDWQALLSLSHFYILTRDGQDLPDHLQSAMQPYLNHAQSFLLSPAGTMVLDADFTPLSVSATEIRNRVGVDQPLHTLTPEAVVDYILHHNLYR